MSSGKSSGCASVRLLMRGMLCLAVVGVTGLIVPGAAARAESAGPVLEVRTATGQTRFHVGERIALELVFTGPEGAYEANTASYDRSGRMSYEEFKVEPGEGWSDPLADYFAVGSWMGGGLSSEATLSPTKPFLLPLNLNEWVRFDRPGLYQVAVVSHRVSQPSKGGFWDQKAQVPLRSEPIQLQIIAATPEWQAERLRAVKQVLRGAAPTQPLGPVAEPVRDAVADLRYLGSKEAIVEMAANLRQDQPERVWDCGLGLVGLPDAMHGVALEALRRQMADPQFPVGTWFLTALARLSATSRTRSPITGEQATQLMEEQARLRDAAWQEALEALGRKVGKARAATAQTLLNQMPQTLSAASRAQLGAVLAASFAELPEEAQASELQYRWDALPAQSMLPTVERLAKLPLENSGSNQMPDYNRRGLKAAALERWYELDPEPAKEEVLREIGSAKPSLTAQSLAWFPKQPLPQFEGLWAQALLETEDYQREQVVAGLLARFGTGAAVAQVRAKLESKKERGASAPVGSLLAYMVEFEPSSAGPLLRHALGQREGCERGCSSSLFQDVAAEAHGTVLTDVALESLENPNDDVVNDALIYLTGYGDQRAEAPVTKRYFEWAERWAGKEAHFETREAGSLAPANYQEMNRGVSLGRAVMASQGWIADKETIARVVAACVGEQMCQQLKQIADTAGAPFNVRFYRDANGTENHQVAQYTAKSMELLEAKLKQFPRGTSFVLQETLVETGDQKRLVAEGTAVFERAGMKLVRTP